MVPVAGDVGAPVIRYLNRKRVVAVSFAAAHFVGVAPALTELQESESASWITICQPLYSGSFAPVTKTLSVTLTPVLACVPVCARVLSAFPPERFVRIMMDPLCTVTVSLLRVSASFAFAVRLPPSVEVLPATDRGT